ncbi:MAG: type I-U CRISPR-associated protein Cas7, partial [Planctomycetes bacterium]|nr:type I-U CRISPR-associated protein Cas7 [Planctomycetota bacterium]
VITVDFSGHDLREVGRNFRITSLDAPHRIADAILRDSVLEVNGQEVNGQPVLFKDSEYARRWGSARLHNATELFRLCPTALIFGTWGSPEKPGGLGAKFARAIVSEIVAIDVAFGVKTSSRIDPLGIQSNAGKIYDAKNGGWTMKPGEAKLDSKNNNNPVLSGSGKSAGKPSAINHGNITPDISKPKNVGGVEMPLGGGVTMDHAVQTTVLSLSALRRLEFPVTDGKSSTPQNVAARTALAALGICAATLARTDGDLRSRCQLVPVNASRWEIINGVSEAPPAYDLSPDDAVALLKSATEAASTAGIPWQGEEIKLKPSPDLVELVKRSQETPGEGNAEETSED